MEAGVEAGEAAGVAEVMEVVEAVLGEVVMEADSEAADLAVMAGLGEAWGMGGMGGRAAEDLRGILLGAQLAGWVR